MKQHRKLEEIHDSLCNNIKRKYNKKGNSLTDEEGIAAANNLLAFCQKVIDNQTKYQK